MKHTITTECTLYIISRILKLFMNVTNDGSIFIKFVYIQPILLKHIL